MLSRCESTPGRGNTNHKRSKPTHHKRLFELRTAERLEKVCTRRPISRVVLWSDHVGPGTLRTMNVPVSELCRLHQRFRAPSKASRWCFMSLSRRYATPRYCTASDRPPGIQSESWSNGIRWRRGDALEFLSCQERVIVEIAGDETPP